MTQRALATGPSHMDRFQSRTMMGQSIWNRAAQGFDQRRRPQDLRNNNMTNNQKRGQSVWEQAMRNAHEGMRNAQQGKFGSEMCGDEECGLDKHLGDRDLFEKLYGAEMCGAEECGLDKHLGDRDLFEKLYGSGRSDGPGPYGPGPWGPGPQGPWEGPQGRGPWAGPNGPGWGH